MKTVMLFGTFDLIHYGHISLFHQARRFGENLVVVVGRDTNIKKIKGRLPIHTEKERFAMINELKLIDKVVLGDRRNVYKIIKKYCPDVIALGYDQKAYVGKLKEELKRLDLSPRIVRLRPYRNKNLKSQKIREKISREI